MELSQNNNHKIIYEREQNKRLMKMIIHKTSVKSGIIILFLLSVVGEIYSQEKTDSFIKKHFYGGFGIGPETGISGILPKISYYSFKERKSIESYYGIEGSVWVVGAGMFSADFVYGIKKSIFTIDSSIGLWWYPKTDRNKYKTSIGPYFHGTINPKLGIKFWKLWIKAGPGIFIFRDYPKSEEQFGILDITKLGNTHYNIEILFKF